MSATEETWPALPFEAWRDTCETLHMWMQVVGKVKLALAPFLNEWWEVAFHPTARGMTTGLTPCGDRMFEVQFDFIEHNLAIEVSDGQVKVMPLMPRTVADFYGEFMAALRTLGIEVTINTTPTEVPHPIPFEQDREHTSYDAEYVHRFWRILLSSVRVFQRYRSDFVGKSSPIQFFWGSFDLSETRFSGRPAPLPDGPRFYRLSEDQENIAAGFWPGNVSSSGVELGKAAYYSYTYPAPKGFESAQILPAQARYDDQIGAFLLLYDDIRQAAAPDEMILEFLQSTYQVGATLGGWDRKTLERTA